LEEAYAAQQLAEQARAARDEATGQADVIVNARISKERLELEAEADAEQARRRARGEADATFARMEAQARGVLEMLEKQAEGFGKLVTAAGGDTGGAVQLMLADKIEELVKIQVEAVKNLHIDKITVWDSMSGEGGSPTTSNFLAGILKSIPPLSETFKMAGMRLPDFLGEERPESTDSPAPETAKTEDEEAPGPENAD
jgi:flotillin